MCSIGDRPVDFLSRQPKFVYHNAEEKALGRPELFQVEYFLEHAPVIRSIAADERLNTLLALLLNDRPVLFSDKLTFKEPGSTAVGAHQDAVWFGWELFARPVVTVLIAVEKATRDNGCFQFAVGGHLRGRMGNICRKNVDPDLEYLSFEMSPGDVILYDGYLPHRTGKNTTTTSRKAILLSFNGAAGGDQRHRYIAHFQQLQRRSILTTLLKNVTGE
jgi:ectoine hydroxylase-related dioxygenase (phytanoyl-CoA dioxygenase family)